jgi:hypothetical protein
MGESMSDSISVTPRAMAVIGKEYPPPGEAAATQKLRDLHLKIQSTQGPGKRGEHPKQHAGLWVSFEVEKDIPSALRNGIFQTANSYTALVRFSNGRTFDDRQPDVHGMAVKIFVPVEGKDAELPFQQDIILADHAVFFARDVQHILDFLVATASGTPASQLAMTTHPKLIGYTSVAKSSPLSMTYWSQTPYNLGDGAVKYVVSPSSVRDIPGLELKDSPDALKLAMVEQLTCRKISAKFDLCVIPQSDAEAMPIEDPTIEWTSTPVKLATIVIYPQKFDFPELMAFAENLTWNPWNSLPPHRPLGGINRARRELYADSQSLRHKINGVQPPVPTGRESF